MALGKLYSIVSFVIVAFLIFIVFTQILGVPLWWIFRGVFKMSMIEPNSQFDVSVNPEAPINIGDKVTVLVIDTTTKLFVYNATISVYRDSGFISDYYTDSNGKVTITYVGEVTVIKVNKDGYALSVQAIPQVPDKYVRDQNNAIIGGLISGIPSSILTVVLQQRLAKRKPIRKRRNK